MAEIHKLNADETTSRPVPKRIMRPCDYGLIRVINDLEVQVGTVEAYNKLCDAAAKLKMQIDAGEAKQALVQFATDPKWIYPRT